MAASYVGISGFEHVFYVAGVVGLLIMLTVTLSEAVGRPGALDLLVGAVLLALHDRRGLAPRERIQPACSSTRPITCTSCEVMS